MYHCDLVRNIQTDIFKENVYLHFKEKCFPKYKSIKWYSLVLVWVSQEWGSGTIIAIQLNYLGVDSTKIDRWMETWERKGPEVKIMWIIKHLLCRHLILWEGISCLFHFGEARTHLAVLRDNYCGWVKGPYGARNLTRVGYVQAPYPMLPLG